MRLIFLILSVFFTFCILNAQDDPVKNVRKGKINLAKSGKKDKAGEDGVIVASDKSKPKSISIKKKNEEFLVMDWIAPLGKKLNISGNVIEIKMKVISSQVVEREDIILYHNDRRIGSKADEVSLFGNVNETEFTYKNQVLLDEGQNKIQLGIETKNGIKKSEPKFLKKEGNNLVDVTAKHEFPIDAVGLAIYWVSPDPLETKGKPLVKNDRNLSIQLIVRSGIGIDKKDVEIIHNNVIGQPSFKSKLRKINPGKYTFEDHIQLNEKFDINEILVRINTSQGIVESEELLVDFTPFRPNLYIIAIGTETNLAYTEKDAKDFSDLYKKQGGKYGNRLFNTVNVQTLLGTEATSGEIKGRIEELKVKLETGNISENDVIIIFISSHGFLFDDEFRIQGDDYDPARKRSTSVSYQADIAAVLEELPCKKLVFIDACHSGGGGARSNIADINYEIKKLNQKKKGLTTIVSSKGDEESYEDVVWQNGAFTEAIIQGLKNGLADKDENSIVTIDELFDFISGHVAKIVSEIKRKPQHPAIIKNDLGDLAIYVIQ